MKRLFLMLLATVSLIACNNDNGNGGDPAKPIELTEGTTNSQTVFADETQKAIKFTATAPWTATVNAVAVNKAGDDVQWITLSATEGKAGDNSISLTILPNTSGADRKAEIRIVCAGTTITVTVEQKATIKPEDPNAPKPAVRYLKKMTTKSTRELSGGNVSYDQVDTYEYDNQMRITKLSVAMVENYNGSIKNFNNNVYFAYKDNTIAITSKEFRSGVEQEERFRGNITLNPDGTAKESFTIDVIGMQGGGSKEYKTTSVYTYTQGNVTKVDKSSEGENKAAHSYVLSWNGGNLSKVTKNGGAVDYDEFKYSTTENKLCNWDLSRNISDARFTDDVLGLVARLGLLGKPSKRMPSSLMGFENGYSYEHTFVYDVDSQGYVISCKEDGFQKHSSDPNKPYSFHNTRTIEYVK